MWFDEVAQSGRGGASILDGVVFLFRRFTGAELERRSSGLADLKSVSELDGLTMLCGSAIDRNIVITERFEYPFSSRLQKQHEMSFADDETIRRKVHVTGRRSTDQYPLISGIG